MAKRNTTQIGQYLLAQDNKTTYLKLEAKPNADDATKKLIEDLKKVLGTDVIYVNRFDNQFREKYKIPKFVKGTIAVEVKSQDGSTAPSNNSTGVDF